MYAPKLCTARNMVRIAGNLLCLCLVLLGAALSSTTGYVLYLYEYIAEVFGQYVFYGSLYALLGCGVFTILVGFIGFYDFTHENRFTSIIAAVGFCILCIIIFIVGVLLMLFPRAMPWLVLRRMKATLPEYGQNIVLTKAWDYMQSYLRCCAIDNLGWSVYNSTTWFRQTNTDLSDKAVLFPITSPYYLLVPASCCATLIDGITEYPTDVYRDQRRCQNWQYGPPMFQSGPHNDALYYRGCFDVLIDYTMLHTKHLFGLSLATCAMLVSQAYINETTERS
ncbi:unnamed protein product [Dicrocoelium dendriticum]|nr:unnamed protein product [Dicrocoelium dendriticum]